MKNTTLSTAAKTITNFFKVIEDLKKIMSDFLKKEFEGTSILVTNNWTSSDHNRPSVNVSLENRDSQKRVEIKIYNTGKVIYQGFRKLSTGEKKKYDFLWDNHFKTSFKGTVSLLTQADSELFFHDLHSYLNSKKKTALIEKPEKD